MIRTLLPSFLAACLAFSPLAAQEAPWRHGSALLDEPKYPARLQTPYDYVNPNAPKGGVVRLFAFGTFDNFNPVLLRWRERVLSPSETALQVNETLTTTVAG